MKKIIALILIIISVFSLYGCGEEKYPPVASTEDEARVVFTVEIEDERYEIKYELYRAFFLTLREDVDKGDSTVWSGADKDKYVTEIDSLIKSRIAEIYSVFHLAKKLGIDVYSKEYDSAVEDYVSASVNGFLSEDAEVVGFDGDYDKFLEYLKTQNLNYSTHDLLVRYSLASEDIYTHYAGNLGSEDFVDNTVSGALKYTREDVLSFYNSADCVRVLRAYIPIRNYPTKADAKNRALTIREKILDKANYGEEDVANYIIGISTIGASDVKAGELITRHNLDATYYSEMTEAAFSLKTTEVSELIEVSTASESGYFILYKTSKSQTHFDTCYDSVVAAYIQDYVGKTIDTETAKILECITATDLLGTVNRAEISMN
jgi:hypothetical protein